MITPDGYERNLRAMQGTANRFHGTFADLIALDSAWPLSVKAWLFLRALERAWQRGEIGEKDYLFEREKLLTWRDG